MIRITTLILLMAAQFHAIAQSTVSGLLIVKVKKEHAQVAAQQGKTWQPIASVAGTDLLSVSRMFPHAIDPMGQVGRCGLPMVDLTRTYKLSLSTQADLTQLTNKLMATGAFEWVETTDYSEAMYTPNDPNLANQNHLTLINAFAGWDETQGDTNVVIGITDTSFDLLHPDLSGNVKHNYADPVNSTDDDMDGYIDNFNGWDIFGNDNNLFFTNEWHGTSVTAVLSATTDNAVGVAGVGFKCKFLPVKVGNDATNSTITTSQGLEAIAYCADRGCKVINCSWGSVNPSQAGQDAINYAVINKDACVVAAAGNVSGTAYYFPASYNLAVSVTGISNNMLFNNGTNPTFTYNDSVDFCAQGINVYSTATVGAAGGNPVYSTSGGTSLATPQVCGALALVRSKDTCLTALEAIALLLDSAVNIDAIGTNTQYAGTIGRLVDIGAALSANPCTLIGVAEDDHATQLLVYPNPSPNQVTVKVPYSGMLMVYDTNGRQVAAMAVKVGQTILPTLETGLYVVQLIGQKQTITTKLSVVR